MTTVVYGTLARFDPPARAFPPLPEPEPLPDGTDEQKHELRRRRTTVCASLTVNGAPWELGDSDEAERGRLMQAALSHGKATLRCRRQPGLAVAPGYALDICLTSNCRACPFRVEH